MNEELKTDGYVKQRTISQGINEVVLNGETFYRVYTLPINNVTPKVTESLFGNIKSIDADKYNKKAIKYFVIMEPYYDPIQPLAKKVITCCHIDCNKEADYSISSGPFDDQTTYACLQHLPDLLDDSKHFNVDKVYPQQEFPAQKTPEQILDELKELTWKFTTDIEEQHGENTWHLPDSFLPLLHYLRGLDESCKLK